MKRIFFALVATGLSLSIPAQAATTVGSPTVGNLIPFSTPVVTGITTYQQLYSASAFAGVTSIDTVSFDLDRGDTLATADLDISFYLSPMAIGGLSTTAADNLGASLSNFGSFSLAGAAPSVLSFTGPGFNYDPLDGNLIMQINLSNVLADGNAFYFRDVTNSLVVDRYFGGATGTVSGTGLVTTFSTVRSAVPEPATWAFIIFGFGAVGGALRSNRRRQAKAKTTVSYA